MILGLFTGLFQIGGIEQVSRHTAAVLTLVAHNQGQQCQILSLNDKLGLHSFIIDGYECSVRGFARHKLKFIAHALSLVHQIQVAYIGHPNLAPLGLLLQLVNPRLKYWVGTHGVEVWSPLSLLSRLGLHRAHGVTAVSRFTAEQMIKAQRLPPHTVVVLPPALEPGFTNASPQGPALSLPSQSRLILTVGRLIASEPGKGVDMVIRALPKILEAVPHTLYVVVGDGDYHPFLQGLADAMGVHNKVLFVGEKKVDELKTYYARADILAMPSRQEGFGVVFLEAMAFGKPVIGGNHGGTPDIIRDGVTGFLVEYGDVDGLASRILSLLQDEGLRQRMGQAGQQYVEGNFTFTHFQRRLVHLLTGASAGVF